MESRKIYPLRNDIVFKLVFGREGNEPLLACLIEAILGLEGDRAIRELTYLNPLNLQNWADEKFTIVDVKAIDRSNRRFSIEMQANGKPCFEKRMAYYLASLYVGQLHEGEGFEKLFPAYGIAILDYIMFASHGHLQSVFDFREQKRGTLLPDLMELHFIELPKYRAKPRNLRTRLEKWLYILRFGELFATGEILPEEISGDEELTMTVKELRRINADEQMRAILEQRDKEERDRITGINHALAQGREEGREEGIHAVARTMLANGQDPEFIARMTGLSLAEINRLQEPLPKQ